MDYSMKHLKLGARRSLGVVTAAALATGLAITGAGGADARSDEHSSSWTDYLLTPASVVAPEAVSVLSGNVANSNGLVNGRGGATTLTVAPGGAPATVLLDFGVDVSGVPFINVAGAPTTPATVALAFSESRAAMRTPGNSKLASAAATGDTTVTVASSKNFAIGDSVSFAQSTASPTVVGISGNVLSLSAGLGSALAAGTPVTSAPGAVTGDSAFTARTQNLAVTSGSNVGTFAGGERFEAITLSSPGTVSITKAGINFSGAYRATADKYQGHFLSSSDSLNKIWYTGAYSEQLNMQEAGINGAARPSLLDGAKRDRAIWSGDLLVEGAGIYDSLGSNGSDYVKQSLLHLIDNSKANGPLLAQTLFGSPAGYFSSSYSQYTLQSAVDYYRYTGDSEFIAHVLPKLEAQAAYDKTLTNSDGLIVTTAGFATPSSGLDWDFYDGVKTGVVTEFNVLYYKSLIDLAYAERNLGNTEKARGYEATAASVKDKINSTLFDPSTGAYRLSDSDATLAQDANSLAILDGVAPRTAVPGIVAKLATLKTANGVAPFAAGSGKSALQSPFVSGYHVAAAFAGGFPAEAYDVLHRTFDQQIDTENPGYTGATWENYNPDGTIPNGGTSLAHGWGSGPTSALTSYVLGVTPVDPGYSTFTVSPSFSGLDWAEGAIPTPHGAINISWKHAGKNILLKVEAPNGATGTIDIPGQRPIAVNAGRKTTTVIH
jgi:hypothetical protein